MMNTLVGIAARNLTRRLGSSLGAIAVMAVSVMALSLLASYSLANRDLIREAFMRWGARGHLIIERPTSSLGEKVEGAGQSALDEKQQHVIKAALDSEKEVESSARILRISGAVSSQSNDGVFAGIGIDIDGIRRIKGPSYEYDVVAGEPLWMTSAQDPVVIGQGLARVLGCRVPDRGFAPTQPGEHPQTAALDCPSPTLELVAATSGSQRVNAVHARVTGIMDWGIREINDHLVVLPMASAQTLLNTHDVSEFRVRLHEPADVRGVAERLQAKINQAGVPDLRVFPWDQRATFFRQVNSLLTDFLIFLSISCAAVAFSSMLNATFVNFMRRQREFGTLRSLGFSRGAILTMTALENAGIGLCAALVGTMLACGVTWLVKRAHWVWTPPGSSNAVVVDLSWLGHGYGLMLLAALLISVAAGWIPIKRILVQPIRNSLTGH